MAGLLDARGFVADRSLRVAQHGRAVADRYRLVQQLDDPDSVVDPESEGAHRLAGLPVGRKMGRIVLGQGHMALLPVGAAYRLSSPAPCAVLFQSILGPESVQKWAEICQR